MEIKKYIIDDSTLYELTIAAYALLGALFTIVVKTFGWLPW